jgi:hypothetical protein
MVIGLKLISYCKFEKKFISNLISNLYRIYQGKYR